MKNIKTDDLKNGMVVAKKIEDSLGRVILKPGDNIKESVAARLSKWGVEEVWIESDEDEGEEQPKKKRVSAELKLQIAKIESKYEHYKEDSHMHIVKQSTINFLEDSRMQDHLK